MNKTFLCYEDFGAKGDGVTDDIEAIFACHEEANKTGTPVKTKDDATYYIGRKALTVNIMTDVDFGKSKFIIDDRNVEDRNVGIFKISSEYEAYPIEIESLKQGQEKINIPHKGDNLFVYVENENRKIFIRKGLNQNSGRATSEVFKVDKDGFISPAVNWDYNEITKAYARCIDDKPITVKGGIFTTIANQEESFYNYYSRGIFVKRSNVTIDGMKHYVKGEGEHGAPYGGFISFAECTDCTLKNCLLTPRFIYYTESKIPGQKVAMGSYDLNTYASINMKYININQTVDVMDTKYWGINVSNYCKDLYFENCTLSRYDAHEGVNNITIKGCTFGHQAINLIGFGEALIEDTLILTNHFISLRGDYGSFWKGNLTVKNCRWEPKGNEIVFIAAGNSGDHDFGYKCMLPHTITIDGLYVEETQVQNGEANILPLYDNNFSKNKPYPYEIPSKISIKNIITESGREISLTKDMSLYDGTEIQNH